MIRGVLAGNLHRLSLTQLNDELVSGLERLPNGSSLGTAFEFEKVRRNDFSQISKGAKSREDLIVLLLKQAPILQSNYALATEIVDGCGGSADGFGACVKQQHSFYEAWVPRFNLPPEEFERIYQAEIERAKGNPLIRQFTPALPRFRWAEAYGQTRRALLRAAIAVRQNGQSALERQVDPYDGRPFSYIAVNGGFRLESRLRDGGPPISLSFVRDPQ